MWTTGLVSLSIHEALTFEGVEIALNPDLFNDNTSRQQGVAGRSLGNSTKQKPHHQRTGSLGVGDAIVTLPSDESRNDEGNRKPPILNSASFSTATSLTNRRLEVGDMIEVRVWDPIPGSAKNSPKALKRRSPPASKETLRAASASNSVATEGQTMRKKSSTSVTLEAAVSTLQKTAAASSSGSLQYSMDSSFPTSEKKVEPAKEADSSTVSSIEHTKETIGKASGPPSPKGNVPSTVTAASDDDRMGMPPTFPRNRTDTADGNPRQVMSKPPSIQRTRANATAPADATEVLRKPHSSRQPATAAKSTGIHVRDISDMTMDTILGSHIIADDVCDDGADEDDTLSRISSTHSLRLSFVMLVTEGTLNSLKETARTQVSMLRQVADLYNLSSYDMVTVNRISKEEEPSVLEAVSADFVTVTIKDQYISRGDMHFFQKSLIGRWIYEGQRLSNTTKGVQAHAREIRHGERFAKSGIFTEDTMMTFRTRSARIFWLVQISSDMYDYASPYNSAGEEESSCEIYFSRFVRFMHRLFERWQELEVTHSLTVVFFSRTYLNACRGLGQGKRPHAGGSEGMPDSYGGGGASKHSNVDVCGRMYEDHYKTVIENETTTDWESLISKIKGEFVRYPFEVGWNLLSNENGRRPSTAAQGNLLEAINVTLNLMQFHFMDRDLHRVGNSLVIISAGCGVFEVDRDLAGITYQRMMDNGIGSDMLSLGLPPLHTAPFFIYNNDLFAVEAHGIDEGKNYHEIPHWMHLSFFSYGDEAYSQDVEHTLEKREPISTGLPSNTFEVAPNGFYIPNLQNEAEQSLMRLDARRASFSALANVAASPIFPSKSKTRQRQLISGRKFADILEACRPGTTRHAIPSALSSMLTLYEIMKKSKDGIEDKPPVDGESTEAHQGSTQLKEWGAVDLDTIDGILSQSPTALGMRQPHEMGSSAITRDQMSDRSSPTSSFSSHLSNLMSRSLDRASSLYSYGGGFQLRSRPMVDGIQMQRSPSMDSLAEISDDTESDNAATASKKSDQFRVQDYQEEMDDGDHPKKQASTDAKHMRKLMIQHDKNFFQLNRSNLLEQRPEQLSSYRKSDASVESECTTHVSNVVGAPQSVGGLGAALQNYNSSTDPKRVASDNPSITRNMSFCKSREMNHLQSPYSLSRSLGPFQGTPLSSQFRTPVMPSRGSDGSDPLENVPAQRGKRSVGSNVGFLVASSPPRANNIGQKTRSPPNDAEDSPMKRLIASKKNHQSKRRSRTLNPFKQQDEEAVLAEKSHNRRRWSHVFPLGEIEFKRHAGPNWLSLSQPAILPLTIDYFPPPLELNTFLIRLWDIEVDLEGSHYKSHSELIMEMIRQRLTQEYQIVPKSVVRKSRRRDEAAAQLVTQDRSNINRNNALPSPLNRNFLRPENNALGRGRLLKPNNAMPQSPTGVGLGQKEIVEHNLSMGHTIHVLRYDPNTDEKKIVVTQLSKRRLEDKSIRYKYLLFSPISQNYVKVVQDFREFATEYNWNAVDHLVGGIEAKKVVGEMKFRQLMFALIPEQFADKEGKQAYVEKFQKLLEYLNKLREGDDAECPLEVEIISGDDKRVDPKERVPFVRREAVDMMKRITVQLRKGKRDLYEWVDIAVDPTFDTRRSYRVIIQWLAASSSKVEAQIQLIQRRCSQYGLKLVSLPELSISPNLFLNPLHAPSFICIRNREHANLVDASILKRSFVEDGIHLTEKTFLECIENSDDYKFGRRRRVPARQFVHQSGTLFIRLIRDERERVILVGIENRMLTGRNGRQREISRSLFRQIESFVETLPLCEAGQQDIPTR